MSISRFYLAAGLCYSVLNMIRHELFITSTEALSSWILFSVPTASCSRAFTGSVVWTNSSCGLSPSRFYSVITVSVFYIIVFCENSGAFTAQFRDE
jgi:hypothetical protein